jgi:hypothetical protein
MFSFRNGCDKRIDIVIGGRSQPNNGRLIDAMLSADGGSLPTIPGQPSIPATPTVAVIILPPVSHLLLSLRSSHSSLTSPSPHSLAIDMVASLWS